MYDLIRETIKILARKFKKMANWYTSPLPAWANETRQPILLFHIFADGYDHKYAQMIPVDGGVGVHQPPPELGTLLIYIAYRWLLHSLVGRYRPMPASKLRQSFQLGMSVILTSDC